MNRIFRQIRAQGEGRTIILPSLLVALFLLCGCGLPGVDDSVYIEGQLHTEESITEIADINAVDNENSENSYNNADNGNEDAAGEMEGKTGLVVHICGEVENPGVYELPQGSRVIDAVAAAGGFTAQASLNAVNLACEIIDASQIYIPGVEEVKNGGVNALYGGFEGQNQDNGLININTANEERLTQITGIGATRARAIVAYREEHGAFKNLEEITRVSGIGEATYAKIKDQITLH